MNPRDLGSAVAAGVATLLGSLALAPVFSSGAWLPPVAAAVVVVLAGGLLLRAAGPALWPGLAGDRPGPRPVRALGVVLVPVGQLLLLACLLTALYAPADAFAGVLPTWTSGPQLAGVLADGLAEMREQATPALTLTGLLALTTLFVGLVAVAVDVLAVAGRQASLGGVGLLVLACVPVTTTEGGIGLVALAAPAAGFALLLWADQHRRLPARGRPAGALLGTGVVAAVRTGAVALVAGIVIGTVVPTLDEGSLTTGLGGGTGSSTGTALDPVAALQGQLTLREPVPLFRLDTTVADPGYLRAVTLDQYDGETGWSMSNLDGETSIGEDDRLAPLPPDQTSRQVTASIDVLQHDDRFLPLPFSPLSVRVEDADPDDWRFDPATGTVFGRNVTTGDLSYTVTAVEPRPSAGLLAASAELLEGDVQERFTRLPPLELEVTNLVGSLIAGAGGPYERVRAIHDHLTDRSNGFIYSLSTEPGTSGNDLVDFLRLKRGYCEQYAGTMAVMVRAAGVPARVALGYTPGSSTEPDGSRLITSDDAHAWVEVFFDELGWVPFDPTPIAAGRAVDLDWAPRAGAEDSADESAGAPAPTAPAQTGAAPRVERADEAITTGLSGGRATGVSWPVLAGAGAVLLGAALLGMPAGVRALQRRRRLAEGTAGALWDELIAGAQDLGIRLHAARTPRQTAGELVALLSGPGSATGGAASEAVHRLARAEETASYGREGSTAGRVAHPDDVLALRTVRRAMLRSASRRSRLLARWWPASLVSGAGARLAGWARERLAALTSVRRAGRAGTA